MSIPEDSASTRLNSTVVPDGETLQDWDQPQADLVVDPEELRAMGEDAHALSRILTAGPQASGTTYSAAAALSNDGFATGSALHHTMARFFRQSMNLHNDCVRVGDHLTGTSTAHATLEEDIATQLRSATQDLQYPGSPSIVPLADVQPTEIAGVWGGEGGADARV
ncbi:hypothetical protein ACWC9S_17925 [Streptomyces xiamenensis]